jgi:hypothetical protein
VYDRLYRAFTTAAVRFLDDNPSYFAVRRRLGPDADAWWAAARHRTDVPGCLFAMLAGRERVELTRDEAIAALEWADGLDAAVALAVYPSDPRVAYLQ